MAEQEDAPDLGSGAARRGGSNPFTRTTNAKGSVSMETTEIVNDGLCRLYQIDLDDGEVEAKLEERINEIQPTFALHGFRLGKVPKRLIWSKFGSSVRTEVSKKYLDDAYEKLLSEFKGKLAARPQAKLVTNEENKILGLKVYLELQPEIPDLDHSTLKVERPVQADEFKLNRREKIEVMRSLHKSFRERSENSPAQLGDLVEFERYQISDGKRDKAIELDRGVVLLSTEEIEMDVVAGQLVGQKVSDTFVTVIDPKRSRFFFDMDPPGGSCEIAIYSVCEPVPADDSTIFAEMECENLDEAVEKWESHSKELFQLQASHVWRANLGKALMRSLDFEVPPTVHAFHNEVASGVRMFPESRAWQEMAKPSGHADAETAENSPVVASESKEDKREKYHRARFRKRLLAMTVGRARLAIYFEHIASKHKISVSESELKRELERQNKLGLMSITENESDEELRAKLFTIRNSLLRKKVEDFLIQLIDVSKKEYTVSALFPQYYSLLSTLQKSHFKVNPESDSSMDGVEAAIATNDDEEHPPNLLRIER